MNVHNVGYEGWYGTIDLCAHYYHDKKAEMVAFLVMFFLIYIGLMSYAPLNDLLSIDGVLERFFVMQLLLCLAGALFFSRLFYFAAKKEGFAVNIGARFSLSIIFVFIAIYCVVNIGFVFLIIPSLFFWVATMLAPALVVLEDSSVPQSFKRSYLILKPYIWRLMTWEFLPIFAMFLVLAVFIDFLLRWLAIDILLAVFYALLSFISILMTVAHGLLVYKLQKSSKLSDQCA